MSLTYKDDDSFFTTVLPPFVYYGTCVKDWFSSHGLAKFRYIRDTEAEREFWNLEKIDDFYPGIKTISVAVNPWARMKHAFDSLNAMKQMENNVYFDKSLLDQIPLDKFSNFIASLPDMAPVSPFWFALPESSTKWTEYTIDGQTKSVDFILREDTLAEDFKPIQEFFLTNQPLEIPKMLPKYKRSYNTTTKAIVEQLFFEEIAKYGYNF